MPGIGVRMEEADMALVDTADVSTGKPVLELTSSSNSPLTQAVAVTPEAKDEKENDRHFNSRGDDDNDEEGETPFSPGVTTVATLTSSSTPRNKKYDEAASSSDDDSSYFATHLPEPNSRASFVPGSSFYQSNNHGSNASLSFSDDEDDDDDHHHHHHHHHNRHHKSRADQPIMVDTIESPAQQDHHLSRRITRMHSVSSLVSSTSSDDGHKVYEKRSNDSSSTSSYSTDTEADGRRSPVMGQAAYSFYNQTPTPPPSIVGYAAMPSGGMLLHPQPIYGSTNGSSNGNAGGYGTLQYRPDETQLTYMDPMLMGNQMSTGNGGTASSSGLTNRNTNSSSGGNGTNSSSQRSKQSSSTQGTDSKNQDGVTFERKPSGISSSSGGGGAVANPDDPNDKSFKVYWQRWIMLMYMSVLNLLSDWTCYSVAPIAVLTETAFGDIDPERLVVVFLGANAVASACEPIILARLGLRKTVLFGSLLLMIGSLVKSGGIPPIIPSDLRIGHDEWRLYLGFFLVGLSQPLYQCTPALLSASWFPEKERTMATGVALNANQLGIGFAFIFGTLLVKDADDIPNYFGLLTLISTIVFLGTLIQFDDAPPTPPSSSARVMRGTFEMNLPKFEDIVQSVRAFGTTTSSPTSSVDGGEAAIAPTPSPAVASAVAPGKSKRDSKARKRKGGSKRRTVESAGPSPALSGRTSDAVEEMDKMLSDALVFAAAPSPAMPGQVGQSDGSERSGPPTDETSPLYGDPQGTGDNPGQQPGGYPGQPGGYPAGMFPPGMVPPGMPQQQPGMPQQQPGMPQQAYGGFPSYQFPYWDPRVQQQMQQQQAAYQQQFYYYQQQQPHMQMPPPHMMPPQQQPMYMYQPAYHPHLQGYDWQHANFPAADALDEGAEPIITMTPHHLDIDIRDDQVLLSIRACLSRPGFVHALVAFTVSGIVINTLSTYMDYLVRLNGAPRYYTGVIGGTFQFVIMISSLIIGGQTDRTRAYYSVTIAMLVLGAFGLAECGVSLDANNGRDLRLALIIVAALVGPLQPVSTELGVDVAYPLSENTVLVIQQLFSNMLSALFIPVFKALKDVGSSDEDDERPEYTFSFYLLIVLHTGATVFFATFNGKYLRYEHELEKKEQEEYEAQKAMMESGMNAYMDHQGNYGSSIDDERQPLVGGS
eukprot:scaffold2195_cov132-Cylindrotheca_fusiformis.AAC.8